MALNDTKRRARARIKTASTSTALALAAALAMLQGGVATAKVITVSPGSASTISKAVAKASAGDVIRLSPGTYKGTVKITNSGAPEKPITIESSSKDRSKLAVIDPGADPGDTGHSGFALDEASWITVRNIVFVNAWRNVIDLRDSSYVSVQGCEFRDTGEHGVAVYGKTHHVLVERCHWTQNKKIWTKWSWDEIHHGSLKHYSGGFYGGGNGWGGAVIRRNTIKYVFNGITWNTDPGKTQSNLEFYENTFQYVLDNMIEPENFVWNMHAYKNVMNSCASAPFSIQGHVKGGHILLYGNIGRWKADGQSKSPWTIYKLDRNVGGTLIKPLRIFHNSFKYSTNAFSSRRGEDHIRHYNNAYANPFGMRSWQGSDTKADYDCATDFSHADKLGLEDHGVEKDPNFVDPEKDDYRLDRKSPCIDNGKIIDGATLWYLGKAPDRGAYEGDQLVTLAPIEHIDPPGGATYKEKPRIAKIFAHGYHLALFYTTDLKPGGVRPADVTLSINGKRVAVQHVSFPSKAARVMVLTVGSKISDGTYVVLKMAALPRGTNRETATMWGADLKVIGVPAKATLVGELAAALSGAPTAKPEAPGKTRSGDGGVVGPVDPATVTASCRSDGGVNGAAPSTLQGGAGCSLQGSPNAVGGGLPAVLLVLLIGGWVRRRRDRV